MIDQKIPEGFKELKIPQKHIENMGPGYYKKEDDQLFMIFFAKKNIAICMNLPTAVRFWPWLIFVQLLQ